MTLIETLLVVDRRIYTYCSVYIFKINQEFYYRTDRNDIYEGDIVKVPFGSDNAVRTGRVESISYHTRYDVPYDLNRTKFIIDKLPTSIEYVEITCS